MNITKVEAARIAETVKAVTDKVEGGPYPNSLAFALAWWLDNERVNSVQIVEHQSGHSGEWWVEAGGWRIDPQRQINFASRSEPLVEPVVEHPEDHELRDDESYEYHPIPKTREQTYLEASYPFPSTTEEEALAKGKAYAESIYAALDDSSNWRNDCPGMTRVITEDTAESVLVPVLPADDRPEVEMHWADDILPDTQWELMGQWGTAGYDAGEWPYVFFATTHHDDRAGRLYGYGTYNRGDIAAHWYRDEDACHKAITAEVFWHWRFGGADCPPDLTENLEDLAEHHTTPWV